MRTLIYTAFVSLDGIVDSPGGGPTEPHRSGGWTHRGIEFVPEAYELKEREQRQAGAMLLGRRSYEAFSKVWPSMTEEFPRWNAMPKYVVSSTLQESDLVDDWGETTIVRSLDDVATLKQTGGDPIVIAGSAALARSMADADLIDRYHLLMFPVILGAGKRMFSDADKDKQSLTLRESQAYRNGVVKLVYDVVR